jgi:hypothetical protein
VTHHPPIPYKDMYPFLSVLQTRRPERLN